MGYWGANIKENQKRLPLTANSKDKKFASVGFPDESIDCQAAYEILKPGFIYEVIISKKNIAKGRLDVNLQKFLAFSAKYLTFQHHMRKADF